MKRKYAKIIELPINCDEKSLEKANISVDSLYDAKFSTDTYFRINKEHNLFLAHYSLYSVPPEVMFENNYELTFAQYMKDPLENINEYPECIRDYIKRKIEYEKTIYPEAENFETNNIIGHITEWNFNCDYNYIRVLVYRKYDYEYLKKRLLDKKFKVSMFANTRTVGKIVCVLRVNCFVIDTYTNTRFLDNK